MWLYTAYRACRLAFSSSISYTVLTGVAAPSMKERRVSMPNQLIPTVETVFRFKEYNFTFIVVAYRKVTVQEGKMVFRKYLSDIHKTRPPKGKTIRYQTLIGYSFE